MFSAGYHIHCWLPHSLLVIMFSAGYHIHCWLSCSVLTITFSAGYHIHCWLSCSVLAITFTAGYYIHCKHTWRIGRQAIQVAVVASLALHKTQPNANKLKLKFENLKTLILMDSSIKFICTFVTATPLIKPTKSVSHKDSFTNVYIPLGGALVSSVVTAVSWVLSVCTLTGEVSSLSQGDCSCCSWWLIRRLSCWCIWWWDICWLGLRSSTVCFFSITNCTHHRGGPDHKHSWSTE